MIYSQQEQYNSLKVVDMQVTWILLWGWKSKVETHIAQNVVGKVEDVEMK